MIWDLAYNARVEAMRALLTSDNVDLTKKNEVGHDALYVALGNVFFNISQKSEYAVYTYGVATMADCFSEYLKNQLYQSFIIGEDYYEVYNNDISKRYFVYLAKLRLYSEDRYCKFRNLYNIEDYSNELLIANYNISFLQDYLSRDYIWW